jgi:ABC-type uncharacterized transport system substrate-binding protein
VPLYAEDFEASPPALDQPGIQVIIDYPDQEAFPQDYPDDEFRVMASKRIDALVVIDDAILIANAQTLAQIALRQRLPSSGWSDYAVAGGLLSYGINFTDMFRRAANFVDKILKGAKPSDLPVERASKFETIVNLSGFRSY